MSVMSSVARGSPLRPSRSCSESSQPRPRVEDRRLDARPGHAAERRRPIMTADVAVRDDRATQPGRGGGNLGPAAGADSFARDRRQRGRLAEPGRARAARAEQYVL